MLTSIERPVIAPVMVGRDEELRAFESALEGARSGAVACVVVAGDAGVGKTRLVTEVARRASAAGFGVLQGRCTDQDTSYPFAAVADAFRGWVAGRSPAEVRAGLSGMGPEVVKLLPELGLVIPGLQPTPALEPEAEKRRLFEALARVLGELAGQKPLLVVFEDVHVADQTSLEFIRFILRRLSARPILLVITYRSEEVAGLADFLMGLRRDARPWELSLRPLTRQLTDKLVRSIFGRLEPDHRRLVDRLYAVTEGNPFFTEEVLSNLVLEGKIFRTVTGWRWQPAADLEVPETIRELVRVRLRRLGREARAVLTAAAVIGRGFEVGVLCELTGLDEARVLRLLNQLVIARLVVEESAGRFVFRHPIIREAVYSSLTRGERLGLHRRVAGILEQANPGTVEGYLAELSYHYAAAGAWAETLEYGRRAGERAAAMHAPREAMEHFDRALEAADRLEVPDSVRSRLLGARGQVRELAGYLDAAGADYQGALRLARAARDGRAEWEGLTRLGLFWCSRNYARAGEYFHEALDLGRTLGDPVLVAHSLNRVGNWHANVTDPARAVDIHRQALDIFRRLDDRRGLATTLDLLGMASQLNSDLVTAAACLQEAAATFRQLDDPEGVAASLGSLVVCAATHPHDLSVPGVSLAEAIEAGQTAVMVARAVGWQAGEAYALASVGLGFGSAGDYGVALEAAREALRLAQEIKHPQWVILAHRALGQLYLDLLALPLARSHLEEALEILGEVGSTVWKGYIGAALAAVYVALGQLGQAEGILCGLLTPETPARTGWERQLWAAGAELALARNEPDAAVPVVDRLTASTPNLGAEGVIPRLWTLRGRALAMLRRYEEAEALLQAAADEAANRGVPAWELRAHLALGRLYRAWRRQARAAAEFGAGRGIAERMAARIGDEGLRSGFLGQLTTLLPAAGDREAGGQDWGGLTRREAQVATLISLGKTNREIAEALVVSERTVESHVASIMGKLGFSSRSQVAAWVIKRGLGRNEGGQG